eukprot:8439359-Pyramimonas_sp.AAC.1
MLGVWQRFSDVLGLFRSFLVLPWRLLAVLCEAFGLPEIPGAHVCERFVPFVGRTDSENK